MEIKLGETTIGNHPRSPVFMRLPGVVQGRLIVLAAVVLFGLCVAGALAAAVVWMTRFAKRMATRVELLVQRVSNDVPMLKTLVHVLQTLLLGGFGSGISLFTSSSAQAYGQLLVGLIWMVAAAAAILKVERRIKELEDKSK